MENNDRENDFWNVVQDAVNSGDYQHLNQQVKSAIDDTVDGIRKEMQGAGEEILNSMKNAGKEWKQAWKVSSTKTYHSSVGTFQKSREPGYQAGKRKMQEKEALPRLYNPNPPGKVSGPLMAAAGYIMSGTFLLIALSFIPLALHFSIPGIIMIGLMAGASLGFLGMGIAGSRSRGRFLRFKEYVRQIGNRTYCTIEELAGKTGRDQDKVIRDLKKMIEKGMFLQGHLDQQETCVIVTNEMYQQYLTVQEQAKVREEQQKLLEAQRAQLPEECQKILDEGKEYISYIQKCNDDIPGMEMSQKLSRLQMIITRIFEEVGKNPSLASDLRKFMNYYLPTTRKLLDVYCDMDKETIISTNVEKTKKEIEDTLDTINQAFENLLNSFFEEKALDVSSDISVLQTMFAQEGLTKGDFEELKGKGGEK